MTDETTGTEGTVATKAASISDFAQLAGKYGQTAGSADAKRAETFDKGARPKADTSKLERISQAPATDADDESIGETHRAVAEVKLNLISLAKRYGKLEARLSDTFGSDATYSYTQLMKLKIYPHLGERFEKKAESIQLDAIEARGDTLNYIVKSMATIVEEMHQGAITGREKGEAIREDVVTHTKTMHRKLIDMLRGGKYSDADLFTAEREIAQIGQDLDKVEAGLKEYETLIGEAKAADNQPEVKRLTQEALGLLDIKYGILDNELEADKIRSEISRDMVYHAEGVQSTRGAIAASRVNYKIANALIDSFYGLEVKYEHAMSDMIPTFRHQAQLTDLSEAALESRDTLLIIGKASERLMEINVELATHVAAEVLELLETPIYDVEHARMVEEKLTKYMIELNENKKTWADTQTRFTTESERFNKIYNEDQAKVQHE
ncbi:hypothetical protein HN695_06655 [Candidatus Woesearchaeota archaeon]|nr:hypothetical protein [Candidatus Woesearchaeota archaeon]MBT6040739.1 hypothetical protein [Candidatus Woesearchaeota archaeon]MBT6337460.1 hypothetical protein [Candidatus Woesearchaeota archaeon]MBT7927986.1 hypothetical protein [Candidatus Woesearchaeota archaeon]